MTGERDDQPAADRADEADAVDGKAPARLRVVSGPMPEWSDPDEMPEIRLRREFKGLTIADLHRDEIAARLPGQVRSALEHLEAGDLEAAESALPGQFSPVLPGPGSSTRPHLWWFVVAAVLAVLVGAVVASWLTF